jgi:dTDP-4-amino-4,6-dideoxygalactose transaminase
MTALALNGGTPVRGKPFPGWPVFDDREVAAVTDVIRSGKWWYGEKVRQFEQEFAAFQDARFGVCCTNGTAALQLSLLACGIGAGDEVIVPPYTFMATASAVLLVNAIPVFADVALEDWNLDAARVAEKVTARTKAIIPVHFAGLPADMDALKTIAAQYKLAIIEDACHSWGSKWRNKGTGALGNCGAFSFQVSKNITSGEGGILLSDDEDLAERARSYSNCGRIKGREWYEHFLLGSNLRMTELQAALLLVQLSRLEAQTLKRESNAAQLDRALAEVPGVAPVRRDARVTRRSYHLYSFRFAEEQWGGVKRARFLEALKAEGIPASAGYPIPLYKNPLFLRKGSGPKFCPVSCPFYGRPVDYSEVRCANAEKLCEEGCWITHSALLGESSDMRDIADGIVKVWEGRKQLLNG